MDQELISKFRSNFPSDPGVRFIAAVSGGADSVFLFTVMKQLNLPFFVAHFNHHLRPSATQDARFVADMANKMEIPFFGGHGNVTDFSRKNRIGIEDAAREMRYRFLFKVAHENHCDFVVTAHNADDQVETVLMHLLRGTGLDGLTGMNLHTRLPEFNPSVMILRPLLSVWRSEIEDYLSENQIPFCLDETNLDQRYSRNKIRHQILPFLNAHYDQFSRRLWKTAEILQGDQALLEEYLDLTWQKLARLEDGVIQFPQKSFHEQVEGMQRHLLRRAIVHLQPQTSDVSFETIERARLAVFKRRHGRIDLEDKLTVFIAENAFYIARNEQTFPSIFYPQLDENEIMQVSVPGTLKLSNKWQIQFSLEEAPYLLRNFHSTESYIAFLDFDQTGGFPLMVRSFRPGDQFSPFGMENRHVKLSDYFTNHKTPEFARQKWPVVINAAGEIIWLSGLQIGHQFRITESTRQILRMELSRV